MAKRGGFSVLSGGGAILLLGAIVLGVLSQMTAGQRQMLFAISLLVVAALVALTVIVTAFLTSSARGERERLGERFTRELHEELPEFFDAPEN